MHSTDIFTKDEIRLNGTQNFMGKDIPVVIGGFGEGKKCISDRTIAEIHNITPRDVRKSVIRNESRFKDGIDIIDLKRRESNDHLLKQLDYSSQQIVQAEHIYLLSERGYAKLVKIMDTDLAWEVHDRLMDEYFTYRDILQNISPELQAIIMHDKKIQKIESDVKEVNQDLQEFKRNLPLLPADADEIKAEVNKKAVKCLGGKESNSYKDRNLCQKVYWDIYRELKRQFEVSQYKYIRQHQKAQAIEVIRNYNAPIALKDKIVYCNSQLNIEAI